MGRALKDSFVNLIEYVTYRKEKDREWFLHSLSFFLDKRCICEHKCDFSIVDMPPVARLDIFAFGKFDMFSLCSNSI